jgi:uncharacterized protein (TIGR00369 family)
MDKQQHIAAINAQLPPCVTVLNGCLVDYDEAAASCEMRFDVSTQFCHSGDIVQGGNVTVMLDAAMSHAVFALFEDVTALPSLEIKVSFFEPTRAGPATATGRVIKAGRSTVFLEGELINAQGQVAARASSTAKLVRRTT